MKKYLLILLSFIFFTSCGVSYPKETLRQDAVRLIKTETGVDCDVTASGTTLYVDAMLDDLASQDGKKVADVYKTVQKIVSTAVRIPLSSDADIRIVVVCVFDSERTVMLRLFENMDDIKKYSHQLISRTDYEERQLMEISGHSKISKILEDKHEISLDEFVARLSVSQISLSAKNNPLLTSLISKLNLQYDNFKEDTVYLSVSSFYNYDVEMLLKKSIIAELEKNINKYKTFSIKSVVVYDSDGKTAVYTLKK